MTAGDFEPVAATSALARSHEHPTRVLVVEDHDDSLDALVTILRLWSFDVRGTTSGAQAVRLASCFRPHVAIVDLSLPDVDGFVVASALARLPERPFLIAATGHGEADVRRRVAEAGFDHYALKPWDVEDMHSVLSRYIVGDVRAALS